MGSSTTRGAGPARLLRHVLIAALLAGTAAPRGALAQSPAPARALTTTSVLASADLRADLALLREVYGTLHPGLHRYATPAEVAARFDETDRYFASDRTLGEAFLALTRLTASIRCGHSYPNFWNQSAAVQAALFDSTGVVPFAFRWVGRRMVVTDDHTGRGLLPRGTEVLALNGVAAATVLDSLLPYARADGANDAKRVDYLQVQGTARYHAFDVLFPLRFRSGDSLVTLRVRRPGGPVVTVRVPSIAASARVRQAQDADASKSPVAAGWTVHVQDGVAIMRMPTWSLYDGRDAARRWIDSAMTELTAREVPHLVLDLRGNEGGIDAGNHVLAHLVDAPLRLPAYRRHVRYRAAPDSLRSVLSTWDSTFMNWGRHAVGPLDTVAHQMRANPTLYRLTIWDDETDGVDVVQPVGPRYAGRVWAIVGAANSSATFKFALTLKERGIATLVGQPTGGNRRGINGGGFFFLRLRRTGLEVDVPLVASLPDTRQPDAGVDPDLPVAPSVQQIARGADAELEAIHRAIREARGAARGKGPATQLRSAPSRSSSRATPRLR